MTITGGSALPKDDIDRMMRDAEAHAEEDQQPPRGGRGPQHRPSSSSTRPRSSSPTTPTRSRRDGQGRGRGGRSAELKKALEGDDIDRRSRRPPRRSRPRQPEARRRRCTPTPRPAADAGGAGAAGRRRRPRPTTTSSTPRSSTRTTDEDERVTAIDRARPATSPTRSRAGRPRQAPHRPDDRRGPGAGRRASRRRPPRRRAGRRRPTAGADGAARPSCARQLAERTADLQRLQAEYANYRRRVERDRAVSPRASPSRNVLAELLPVLDDIGRAREHGELEGGFKSVGEALEADRRASSASSGSASGRARSTRPCTRR